MPARKDLIKLRHVEQTAMHHHVVMNGPQFVVVRHAHVWQPPTDVMEDEGRLIVTVEIGGMRDGEFRVAIGAQKLTISGNRPAPDRRVTAYHQLEIQHGEFLTQVTLPWPVDEDGVTAEYEDGFLHVVLPRAKAHTVRRVTDNRDVE
jgi:HSP20 family protein